MNQLTSILATTILLVLVLTATVLDRMSGSLGPAQVFMGDCVLAASIIISTCLVLIAWIKITEVKK